MILRENQRDSSKTMRFSVMEKAKKSRKITFLQFIPKHFVKI